MGYYTRQDLPFFTAAENFTLCDRYLLLGDRPTDPTGSIDERDDRSERDGRPIAETQVPNEQSVRQVHLADLPRALQAAGISWKITRRRTVSSDDVLALLQGL